MAQWYTSSQRHPSAGQDAVQLDDPADEVGVGLLPKGFLALAEQLVEQRRDGVRERVRIEPRRAQGIPCQPAIETQLDVVVAAAQLGQHPADVVAKVALDFQDERGRSALGIVGLPAEELARERVHTRGRLAGPDRAENRHAGIESPLRDRQPFRGRALGERDRVMHFADDDRRAVRRRRQRPRGKAGPEPQTDAHPGEPDPGCAEEKLPGQQRGHAGREVVPRDDGGVHIRRVVADEHGHGIGLGKCARPRPGAGGADAADDKHGADESVTHRAAPRGPSSGPRAGRGAFPQGYIRTGATPPTAAGASDTGPDTVADTPPLAEPRQRSKRGGRSRPFPHRWRGSGRPV